MRRDAFFFVNWNIYAGLVRRRRINVACLIIQYANTRALFRAPAPSTSFSLGLVSFTHIYTHTHILTVSFPRPSRTVRTHTHTHAESPCTRRRARRDAGAGQQSELHVDHTRGRRRLLRVQHQVQSVGVQSQLAAQRKWIGSLYQVCARCLSTVSHKTTQFKNN